MSRHTFKSGDVLFRLGDPARSMFLILSGSVRVAEIGVAFGPGSLARSVCSPRTAVERAPPSARPMWRWGRSAPTGRSSSIAQDPTFGLYLMRLVIQRMLVGERRRAVRGRGRSLSQPQRSPRSSGASLVAWWPSRPQRDALACRRSPARAMRRVQLRGGARRQPARRTFCTLSRLPRAPTKQMGPYRRSSVAGGVTLPVLTPGARRGSVRSRGPRRPRPGLRLRRRAPRARGRCAGPPSAASRARRAPSHTGSCAR